MTDPQQIADIMARCKVVRLALNGDSVPYLLPLNFGMEPDGMTLYLHGARDGTKYTYLAHDNRAAFEMDCMHALVLDEQAHSCTIRYESVVGWGYVDEVTDENEKRHALKMLMRQYHAEDFPYEESPLPHTRVLSLRVQERTAKRRI